MAGKRASRMSEAGAALLAVSKLSVRSSALAEAKANLSVMTLAAFDALSARFTASASDPKYSAVQDLIEGRR